MDAAKKYEYIKTLGEGSYGHVWLCRDRERDCLVAIKKFKDANKDSQAYHLAMREIKLLRATTHEHVVSVIEAFRSQSSGNVYLVMEYADSCLNLELKKHRTGLPGPDVMRVTWQLASALHYLHSKKIIHRDLKPANILLTAAGDLKLCDFGFARDLPPAGQQADMSSYVTTRWYRAPEVVVGADYGAAVDIWALGCLFAELLNGQPLFPGASNMDQLALIVACFGHLPNRLLAKALTNPHLAGVQLRTGNPRNWAVALQQRFSPFGEHAVNLLLSCLNPDPLKRATADEVLRSPYFEPIRLKKVPAMNGTPTVNVTAVASSSPPPAVNSTTATATAAAHVHSATVPASAASVSSLVHPAMASNAEASAAAAAEAAKKVAVGREDQKAQPQQQPEVVATPPTEASKRPPPEPEHQAERLSSGASAYAPEQPPTRPAPLHPAIVAAAPKGAAVAMEVDTPPAAPALPAAAPPQRVQAAEQSGAVSPQQEAYAAAPNSHAAAAAAPVASAAAMLHEAHGGEVGGLLQLQREGRLAANSLSMRASVAAIPMIVASSANTRATTDSGLGPGQAPQVPAPGKAGSTLVHHNKRASEHNFGAYGNHRPGAAAPDMPMRFARVSVINPGVDAALQQHDAAAPSATSVTSPTGSAAAPGGASSNTLISPAGSLTSATAAAAANYAASIRRRSTATGSRLTRVSHTCEGGELREDESEEERGADLLSTVAGAPLQSVINSAASNAPLHPSPLRRHSRLSAVTEPGGQFPPGAIAAAGATAFSPMEPGSAEQPLTNSAGRGSVPQMLSPLGRSHTRNLLAPTVSVGGMMTTSTSTSGAAPTGAATDSGHHAHAAPPAAHAAAQGHGHGHLHATMSSLTLNVSGRERDVSGDGAAGGGGVLRGNSGINVPTPAAPTVGQMRSFTAQGGGGGTAAAAAAAGLMSRPVSNLYICLENGKPSDCASSADSSAAVSPCTPNGGASGGPAPPPGRRHTLVDGPGSILRSMLRSLSNRRSTATSLSGTPAEQQATPTAAATGLQQQGGSVGGAPGQQASLGTSPFCTSRASSNNFIAGGPGSLEATASLSGPVAIHADEHGAGNGPLGVQCRATTTALGAQTPTAGHARIGLPQLSVRANDLGSGQTGSASATGYGPAVVSPAGAARRRASALAPGQSLRMSDAGTLGGQKPGGPQPGVNGSVSLHGMRVPTEVVHNARLQSKQSGGKDLS